MKRTKSIQNTNNSFEFFKKEKKEEKRIKHESANYLLQFVYRGNILLGEMLLNILFYKFKIGYFLKFFFFFDNIYYNRLKVF